MGMLQYGFYKLYPIQMQPPNMAVLNEPLGQTLAHDPPLGRSSAWSPSTSASAEPPRSSVASSSSSAAPPSPVP